MNEHENPNILGEQIRNKARLWEREGIWYNLYTNKLPEDFWIVDPTINNITTHALNKKYRVEREFPQPDGWVEFPGTYMSSTYFYGLSHFHSNAIHPYQMPQMRYCLRDEYEKAKGEKDKNTARSNNGSSLGS